MNNFNLSFFTQDYYVYYQMLFAGILLTLVLFISRLSEPVVIEYGAFIFAISMIISFIVTFFTPSYRYFMLHWFLSSLAYFFFWCILNYICGRYGKPYNGDGGMILLLPGYFLPLLMFFSLIIKIVRIVIAKF